MVDEVADIGGIAGDDIEHAVGQAGLLPQFRHAEGRLRGGAGRFEHEGVARRDAQGDHPAVRDHGGEVPGHEAQEDPHGFPVEDGVVAGRNVHEAFALHELRHAAGEFDDFPGLQHIAHGFVPGLALFDAEQAHQFVQVLVDELLHLEQHLHPLVDGGVRPLPVGLLGRGHGAVEFLDAGGRDLGDDLTRGGVVGIAVHAGGGGHPSAVDEIVETAEFPQALGVRALLENGVESVFGVLGHDRLSLGSVWKDRDYIIITYYYNIYLEVVGDPALTGRDCQMLSCSVRAMMSSCMSDERSTK